MSLQRMSTPLEDWRRLTGEYLVAGAQRWSVIDSDRAAWRRASANAEGIIDGLRRLNGQGWVDYNVWLMDRVQGEDA